jgi:hypothetical protein
VSSTDELCVDVADAKYKDGMENLDRKSEDRVIGILGGGRAVRAFRLRTQSRD